MWLIMYLMDYILVLALNTVDHQPSISETSDPILIKAAVWEPTNGLLMSDAVFPHISHGFRKKVLPVVAYHVSRCDFFNPG